MKNAEYIRDKIDRLPSGYIFTCASFNDEVNGASAAKTLARMVSAGKIRRLSKGRFYKPEQSVFGEVGPSPYQVAKDLLEKDGKVIGYLTCASVYNELGLTTQVGSTIQIGKNEVRAAIERGRYRISFVKQKNVITRDNIPLLQLLDAIRYIQKIPDASVSEALNRLLILVKELSVKERETMARLALKYPPSLRVILGVMFSELGEWALAEKLRVTLNPLTVYRLAGADKVLSMAADWGVIG
jgi:hypothetical protein